MDDRELSDLRNPSTERLATNACATLTAKRIVCLTDGRGQTAAFLAESLPESQVTVVFQDAFPAEDTRDLTASLKNLNVLCVPDIPQDEIDLFVFPVSRGGEAELTRDLMQQGYQALAVGGMMVATVDNNKDTWLHHEIEKLGRNLDRTPKRHGITYRLKKLKPSKKLRDLTCDLAFRDGERLIKLRTEPGVFSHRKLDVGARALIETMEILPGQRVLDIGCGSGAVGLAAGLRAEGVHVHAIDSNVRALRCAQAGAELNGLTNFTSHLSADGALGEKSLKHSFDVAVGNPPYFSHYQIAEIFLQAARAGLKPGGTVWIVTKHAEWLVARMEQLFGQVSASEVRGYTIVRGMQLAQS